MKLKIHITTEHINELTTKELKEIDQIFNPGEGRRDKKSNV